MTLARADSKRNRIIVSVAEPHRRADGDPAAALAIPDISTTILCAYEWERHWDFPYD